MSLTKKEILALKKKTANKIKDKELIKKDNK